MKLAWNNLPLEVWSIVLKCVGDVAQLAECRLVCKAWDSLAEKAMFSQDLEFRDKKTITKVYNQLIKKPHLGCCIQSMHFFFDIGKLPFYKDFFRLTFTPNINAVDGWLNQISLEAILDIVKQSHEKYKLKSLPSDFNRNSGIYLEMLPYFKETLQNIHLTHDEDTVHMFEQLLEFRSLKKLTLFMYDSSDSNKLKTLDNILTQCPHLQELHLEVSWRNFNLFDDDDDTVEEVVFGEWLQTNNIQVSSHKCKLYLGSVDVAYVVDYLLYKFPNATGVMLNCVMLDGTRSKMEYYLNLVKEKDFVALINWPADDMERLKAIINSTKGKRNHLHIYKEERRNGCLAQVVVSRILSKGYADFEITTHGDGLSLTQMVETCGDVVELETNYHEHSNEESTNMGSHLYELLAILPKIEKLQLTDTHIQHQPALVDNLSLERLTQLHICGTIIDDEVMPTLSNVAPLLKQLTLDTCILDINYYQNQRIHLPHTNLDILSILATDGVWNDLLTENGNAVDKKMIEAYKWMQKSISLESYQLMFLRVSTTPTSSRDPTLYFVLRSGMPSQFKQISQEDYRSNVDKWPKMTIICNSLRLLRLNLGALVIDIDLSMERKIEALGDWQMTKQTALASHLFNI